MTHWCKWRMRGFISNTYSVYMHMSLHIPNSDDVTNTKYKCIISKWIYSILNLLK